MSPQKRQKILDAVLFAVTVLFAVIQSAAEKERQRETSEAENSAYDDDS